MTRMMNVNESSLNRMMLRHFKASQLMHAPVMRHMHVWLKEIGFTDAFTSGGHPWGAHC